MRRGVSTVGTVLGLLLTAACEGSGRLAEARIDIRVTGDTTWVIAWYRFSGTGDSLTLHARRPAGQALVFQGVAGAAGFRLDTLPHTLRLVSRQTGPAAALDVRYHVAGGGDTVPLFLPSVAAATAGGVLVRVSGDARPVPGVAPRFRPEPGDGWVARLDRAPAFVVLTRP